MECFSRDSENEEIPKTCNTREADLFKKGGSTRQGDSLHLSTGRATGRALPDQKWSAKSWVPGGPQIYTGLQPDQQGINFHSHCSTSPLLIRVDSSQLDSPVLCQPSRPVTIQVSSSEHNLSCSKNVTSEQVTVQYSKFPSAIGSSKTSTLLQYLPPLLLASTTVGNSPTSNYPTSNNPYKTLQQEHFEHCLGTQCLKPLLLHLLACAYSSWTRAPSTTHVATHRCVCDFSTCLPVPTPPGCALLQLLTWLLTGVCATSPPACLCLLLLDTRSFNYSRGYSQVCVRLLHLLACAYSSWMRAPSTTHVATHRCVCDFSTCLPVPTPPGRALLQLLMWLLTGVCATSPPACLCLLLLDARSFNYSRGYSQVCVRLLHLLACAYSSWTRAPSTTHVATHRCVCDFSTCLPVPTPPGRALLQLLTWLLTGVCATSPHACLCLLLLDARSFNYSRGYSQVCVRLLHLLACAYSSWTRAPSTTHVATHRCNS